MDHRKQETKINENSRIHIIYLKNVIADIDVGRILLPLGLSAVDNERK